MIHLHLWATPNGMKPLLFLEETRLEHDLHWVNLGKDEQFAPAFVAISPNNKIPVIVDEAPLGGGRPVAVFESGAILLYLADKVHRFVPDTVRGRIEVTEWLFWQVGGLGPMVGQFHHFRNAAKERVSYAIARFEEETVRLYGVLERRLSDRQFVTGADYGIADMAIFPWIVTHDRLGISLDGHPAIKDWFGRIAARPATQRAYARAHEVNPEMPAPPAMAGNLS